jgi:diacylglycerol kinase (ATP)
LFNPSAGKGKALRNRDRLEMLLTQMGIPFDLYVTESEQDLKDRTRKISGDYWAVVGAGGDSTFHIMANEMFNSGLNIPLGLIGLGSSNDISREFGLHALDRACLALKERKTRSVDLGKVREGQNVLRYFLGQANIGLGVWVNKYVGEMAAKKARLGKFQALAGTLGAIHSFRSHRIPLLLKIESEGLEIEGQFVLAVFGNIRYWASGKKANPGALPDDGLLDVCLIRACPFFRLAYLTSRSQKGRHTKAKEATLFRSSRFEVSSPEPFEVQADGEIIARADGSSGFNKIELSIVPRALNIIC